MKGRATGLLLASAVALAAAAACNLRRGPHKDDERSPSPANPGNGDAQNPQPAGPESPAPPSPPAPPGPEPAGMADDVVKYAQYCKSELGIPAAVQQSWNCLTGTELPITVDGEALNATNYPKLATHKAGCDIASWLGEEPCSNYAFVQKRQLAPDVEAVLLCRMRSFSTWKDRAQRRQELDQGKSLQNFAQLYEFDSLGLIWMNRRTGKTCYFDYVGKSFGGYVPSPDDDKAPEASQLPDPPPPELAVGTGREAYWKRDARTTWKKPAEVAERDNCVRCHDTGPWKASPWIRQTFEVPVNDARVPYIIVGSLFDTWRKKFPVRAISTTPVGDKPQVCTQCHRIGSQATCDSHVEYAAGKTAPQEMSDRGKSFFFRTWMPPSPASWHGKPEAELTRLWTDAYEKHVAKLKCCCDNPKAKGCTSQDFTQYPIPEPVAGTGPGACL